jgi:putative glutamine amidotransferase
MASRPVIGIPAVFITAQWGFWHEHANLVADTYIAALWEAGGLPLIVPPLGGAEQEALDAVLSRVDGLLLVGGADLDPSEYGHHPHELLEETSHVRVSYELPLVRRAMERDVPILGICRGLQVMNVSAGGTLHQDLVHAGYSDHRPAPGHLDHATFHRPRSRAGRYWQASWAMHRSRRTRTTTKGWLRSPPAPASADGRRPTDVSRPSSGR